MKVISVVLLSVLFCSGKHKLNQSLGSMSDLKRVAETDFLQKPDLFELND